VIIDDDTVYNMINDMIKYRPFISSCGSYYSTVLLVSALRGFYRFHFLEDSPVQTPITTNDAAWLMDDYL
jgi:hypothetical protein